MKCIRLKPTNFSCSPEVQQPTGTVNAMAKMFLCQMEAQARELNSIIIPDPNETTTFKGIRYWLLGERENKNLKPDNMQQIQKELQKMLVPKTQKPIANDEKVKLQLNALNNVPGLSQAKKEGITNEFKEIVKKNPKLKISQAMKKAGKKYGVEFTFDQQKTVFTDGAN